MPNSARFLAYSDGSSIANPGGPGATAYVVYDRSNAGLRFGAKRYLEDGPHPVTNNRMELRAVLEALAGLPSGEAVQVLSDSRYVVDALAVAAWLQSYRAQHGHWPSRVEISSATARLGYPPEVQTTGADAAISYPKEFGRGDEAYRIQIPLHAD